MGLLFPGRVRMPVTHLSLKLTEVKALLLSPSGIFQGNKVNIIGNGVVLDPALFKAEAEALEASGHPLKERFL